MAKAKGWSGTRTAVITLVCGLGHVMGSIILGLIGVFLGIVVFKLESIESLRGDMAAWFLLVFGLLYFIWGIRRALQVRSHEHQHEHADGVIHSHHHSHLGGHSHVHDQGKSAHVTPWVLFVIFVLGPCEPLIPLIMYPAAKLSTVAVIIVAVVFGLVTIVTMLACVMASFYSFSKLSFPQGQRYSHALAGLTVFLCGGAIKFLGL
ncbi:MAG: sulfite exporter TauE/SafE family protein [Desulfuromonadales bacterium]|nr:sulfite exporter TauE/SafE family protein [Desulfuromonadales bacterium]